MTMVKVATITDTEFTVHLANAMPPSVARAMAEWCAAHGINAALVPATSPIVRDPDGCRILYHEIQKTPDAVVDVVSGQVMAVPIVMQGTTPPTPWPREVLDWRDRIQ